MIFVPPRHGKSMLSSEYFPAWYLGNNPTKQIISATYAEDLATDWGRKVRNQLQEDDWGLLFPECMLSADSQSSVKFTTTKGGMYFAAGVGGPLTGRGADVLLIDDPVKNREDADSTLEREKKKQWYTSTARTRLMPGGSIVVIQTRWHPDDLAGWLLKEHKHENWTVIDLPAVDHETESEPLWPEAFPISELNNIRLSVGPRDWSALYMQRPTAGVGGEFKRSWLRYYRNPPPLDKTNNYILVDPANEKRKKSDFTAIWVVGAGADHNIYVRKLIRDRLSLTERTELLFKLHRSFGRPRVGYEKIGMQSDIEHIYSRMEDTNYRFGIVELGTNQLKKSDRIKTLVPLFQDGRIFLPEHQYYTTTAGRAVEMVNEFIEEEYAAFPALSHDDMLDALAWITFPQIGIVYPLADNLEDAIEYDDTGIV